MNNNRDYYDDFPSGDRPNPGSDKKSLSEYVSDNKLIQWIFKISIISLAVVFGLFLVMVGMSICNQLYDAISHGFNHIARRTSYDLGRVDPTLFWGMVLITIVGIIRLLKNK